MDHLGPFGQLGESMIDIKNSEELNEICKQMEEHPFIALDTEFIRERTYYPILALVQVSFPGQEPLLIDPLEIDDWSAFHQILLNPNICKVFHAGRQDLEIFYHQMNAMPVNIFDTQIAASMCGYGDQIGYGGLVSKLLRVHLSKGSSYTNWLQRPLTKAQLSYARDDVLYLPDVYQKLLDKAHSKKRLEWILEEMDVQLHADLFQPDPEMLWRKVKKSRSLKDRDKPVLQELAQWRDAIARRVNKPLRYILSDEAMIEIAKIDALTIEHLRSRRGIQAGTVDRFGEELLELHKRGRSRPKTEWPESSEQKERPPSEKAEALADLAWILLKEIAQKAHMAPTNLIAKKHLAYFIDAYLRDEDLSPYTLSHGWRKAMVGDLLIKLIDGKTTIRVENHKIIWQDQ